MTHKQVLNKLKEIGFISFSQYSNLKIRNGEYIYSYGDKFYYVFFRKNKLDGYEILFDKTQMYSKIEYSNNKLNGKCIYYHYYSNNLIEEITYYKDDNPHGKTIEYNRGKKPKLTGQFKNDIRVGYFKEVVNNKWVRRYWL